MRQGVLLITDLSIAEPKVALSSRRMPGHWQLIEYETQDFRGTLLSAGPETGAPPVRIPLGAPAGWYAISIGFWAPRWGGEYEVRVKLGSDPAYVHWRPEEQDNAVLLERFWKAAHVAEGDYLEISQVGGCEPKAASVAFVKLAPLSQEEVQKLIPDRSGPRRLIAMNDAFSDFHRYGPTTAEDIQAWIEPYRNTDFGKLFWCVGAGGDVVSYPSKVATVIGQETSDYPRPGDRVIAQSLYELHRKGIDPLKVARDYALSIGLEFHVSQRMGAFGCAPPFEEFFTGPFYRNNPQWRCVDRDGVPVARMSYAYPEVRRKMIEILVEAASYEIDGINLIFNRGAPFVLYEEPVVQGFRSEYGVDPRELDPRDERWLTYRARVMTTFLKELREALAKAAYPTPTGRPLQISAHVLNNRENNLFYGLDVETWVAEGLVDALIVYPWRSGSTEAIDIGYFVELCRDRPVELYIEVMPRQLEPEEYLQWARRIYGAGAYGLSLWDTNDRDRYWRRWAILRRLGRPERLDELDPNDTGAVDHPLVSLGGYRLDRYPPHWAY